MAPSLSSGLKVPHERFLAFAVCIVESTPPDLTVEDYIDLLRQHVAKGRRENALSTVHRHLDRSSYWRAEYERVKDALQSAESEKLHLKLEVNRLRANGESDQLDVASKKRKKQPDPDVVPVPRSPKRPKQKAAEKATDLTPLNVDAGFSFYHLGDAGDELMRSFYQAHAMLKSREKTDPVLLARHLVQGANAVSRVLQQLCEGGSTNARVDVDAADNILTAAYRAMQSLLVGYGRLSHVAHGNEAQGSVIYAYVLALESSLTAMAGLATKQAFEPNVEALERTQRPSTSSGRARQKGQSTVTQTKHACLSAISSFIAGNIELLEARTDAHKALFEGLAYVVIERLADCLYTLVFGRTRYVTLAEEIAASGEPDEIDDTDNPATSAPGNAKLRVAKLEAPYLIQIMTRLMQAAPSFLGASGAIKTGKSKGSSKQGALKSNLAITAKERLQNTLINCMFGEKGRDDEDPFLDCLQKPSCSDSLPPAPAVKEADVQEWYKEEVWRLLGWEILSREGAW